MLSVADVDPIIAGPNNAEVVNQNLDLPRRESPCCAESRRRERLCRSPDRGSRQTSSAETATQCGPTESTNPAAETADRATVESADCSTAESTAAPKPAATKAAAARTYHRVAQGRGAMARERLADLLAGLGIHNRAVLSPDPVAMRSPSRLNAALQTSSSCAWAKTPR